MSQKIKQANIFGRVGSSFGQGLAEQAPKEMDRYQKAKGYQSLADEAKNLDPIQLMAKAYSIPGSTPEEARQFGELARQQNIRNSYKNNRESIQEQGSEKTSQGIRNINFANQDPNQPRMDRSGKMENMPSDFESREVQAKEKPGIVTTNPLNENLQPAKPWTQAQKEADIGREMEIDPIGGLQNAISRSNANEQRYLSAPEAYREQQNYLQGIEKKADDEFDSTLSQIIQKEGKETYKDLTGDMQFKMKKAMRNDLATDPSLTYKTAAEKWARKGKDFINLNNELRIKANRDLSDRLLPHKKEETLKNLKSMQQLYSQFGALEDFENVLGSKNIPPQFNSEGKLISEGSYGFDLSTGGRAMIARPRSESVKKIIKQQKPFGNPRFKEGEIQSLKNINSENSRKFAKEIAENRSYNDSVLAIAREAKQKDPSFDEYAYFDYLRDNMLDLGFNERQQLEINKGVSDFFPNWGDMALFPAFGKSVVND